MKKITITVKLNDTGGSKISANIDKDFPISLFMGLLCEYTEALQQKVGEHFISKGVDKLPDEEMEKTMKNLTFREIDF